MTYKVHNNNTHISGTGFNYQLLRSLVFYFLTKNVKNMTRKYVQPTLVTIIKNAKKMGFYAE